MKQTHKLSPDDIQEILRLRREGVSVPDIGRKFSVAKGTVALHLRKHGLPTADHEQTKLSEEQAAQVAAMRQAGVPLAKISEDTGIKASTVRWTLAKAGVTADQATRTKNSGRKKHSDEAYTLARTMRLAGTPMAEIVLRTGIKKATLKEFFSSENVKLDPAVAQANAQKGKTAYNPDHLEHMRKGLTPERVAERSAAIRAAYEDPALKLSQAERSRRWWASLSIEERAAMPQAQSGDRSNRVRAILEKSGFTGTDGWMQFLAAKHGGLYLGGYGGTKEKARWRCSDGHEFEAIPNTVQQGHWCPTCFGKRSRAEEAVCAYVRALASDVIERSRKIIAPMELDTYVPSALLGVEYNGLFWHSSASPGFVSGSHLRKWRACQEKGVRLFAIFEDEWLNPEKQVLIKAMLRWRLGQFDGPRLDARRLRLERLEKNEQFEPFFEKSHLDGHAQASFAYGLFEGNALRACASFRTNFNQELEVARLATDPSVSVRGAAGRLLSAVDGPLVSFSNNRLSNGDVYKKLGFTLVQHNRPSYWYTDGFVRVWRWRCRRNNDPAILERFPTEEAQALGGVFSKDLFGDERPLYRIEDYGHMKWKRP